MKDNHLIKLGIRWTDFCKNYEKLHIVTTLENGEKVHYDNVYLRLMANLISEKEAYADWLQRASDKKIIKFEIYTQ